MQPRTTRRRPLAATLILLTLGLTLGALGTALAADSYRGPGPIHLDNESALPYVGGTDSTTCDPAKPDEWHFVITGLNTPVSGAAITPPDYIDAVYRDGSGEVIVARTNLNRAEAGYTDFGHLGATLIGAYMTLPDAQTQWGGRFLLSHAPCPSGNLDPPLTVTKTATPSFERSYHWTVTKTADPSQVNTTDSSTSVGYTVGVGRDAGTDGGWRVDGVITVANANPVDVPTTVTDSINDPNAACGLDGSESPTTSVTVPALGTAEIPYSCSFSAAPAPEPGNNSVTIGWDAVTNVEAGTATADAAYDFGSVTPRLVDDCVTVTDALAPVPHLGTVCTPDGAPEVQYTYTRSLPVTPSTCTDHLNTARATTDATATTAEASASVRVCGPVAGGRSMGFWSNKNGQTIITGAGTSGGVCSVTPFLRSYAPFADLSATASCTRAANYVAGVIKAANASGSSMNAMLKAQMLATALDVFFSDPTKGGNPLGAPVPIGDVRMNLTEVCTDLACGTFTDTSIVPAVFGGATCMRVSDVLAYAASQSNVGGSAWYDQVKMPVQEAAKDAFEMIAVQRAFACL